MAQDKVRGSVSHWLRTSSTWANDKAATRSSSAADVDVLIVGGGITGCSLAYHLRNTQPELKVMVVEARGVSEGATGRNGGLMWASLNAPWPTTVAQYGEKSAKQLMDFEMHAFQDVINFIQDHGLSEELQFALFPDGGLILCESKEELDAELADLAAQEQMGVQPIVQPLTPQQLTARLGAHNFVGGLVQEKVGRVTAVRLAHALLERAVAVEPREALSVMQHTRVVAVKRLAAGSGSARFQVLCQPEDSGTVVRYPAGLTGHPCAATGGVVVSAAKVVHCTNGYNHLLPQLSAKGWLVPVRNQVIVTSPLPVGHPLPDSAFYARTGYVYWSKRHDGRVVLGGFRDVTSHMEWGTTDDSSEGLDAYVSKQMRSFLPAVLPSLFATASTNLTPVAPTNDTKRQTPMTPMQQHHLEVAHTHGALSNTGAGGGGQTMCGWDKEGAGPVAAAVPVEYELEWSGILGFTKDRWPLWGALPPELACASPTTTHGPTYEFACMGFSGHGMTRAYTCARNMALLLTGKATEPSFPARIFSPVRVLAGEGVTAKL